MAFARVQGNHGNGGLASASTIVMTLGAGVTAGNTVLAGCTFDTGVTVTSVKDNATPQNTYNQETVLQDGVSGQQCLAVSLGNVQNAPTSITVTLSAAVAFEGWAITEYSGGLAVADPRDGTAHGGEIQDGIANPLPGTGTDGITSGPFTTATNGDLIWGFTVDTTASTQASAGTGYTSREVDNGNNTPPLLTEDKVQTTAGAVAATFTQAANANHITFLIAIKPAAVSVIDTISPYLPKPFLPQWRPTRFWTTAQDFSSFGVETNPHWCGRTFPAQWSPLRALMQNSDPNAPFTQPETNTFFIPRTWPMQWKLWSQGQTTAQDFSSFGVETNPHWVGKSWPLQWQLTRGLLLNVNDFPAQVQAETNTFYRSRTWPQRWDLQASLLRGTPQDFSFLPPASQAVYARYGVSHGIGALSAIPGEIPS